MTKKILITLSASLVSLLILSACGQWNTDEAVKYRGEPLEEPRTIGLGVKQVLSKIVGAKGLNLNSLFPYDPFLSRPMPALKSMEEVQPSLIANAPKPPIERPAYISKWIKLPDQLRPTMATPLSSIVNKGDYDSQKKKIEINKERVAEFSLIDFVNDVAPEDKSGTEIAVEQSVEEPMSEKIPLSPKAMLLEKKLLGYK